MTKVIQIKDVENYSLNIEQMVQNDEDIEKLEQGTDDVRCEITVLLNFSSHPQFTDEQICINHTQIQEKLCIYLKQLLEEWNERLQKNNEELEVEVDLDGK